MGSDQKITTTPPRALAFLEAAGYPLGAALIRHVTGHATADEVLRELIPYQEPDGGFRGLEVDIKAPVSNPFATRMAMSVLTSLRVEPQELKSQALMESMERWLEAAQHEDGDWHFSPEVRQHELAPWFAAWTFPSLNPSAGLSGVARQLGIGSDRLHARVRALFDERATLDEAEHGEFYDVMPYFEYLHSTPHPQRERYLDALATNVVRMTASGGYEDAGHFFAHVEGGGPDLAGRLPDGLIDEQLVRLASEQQEDGGWLTPYDPAWRSWSTTGNVLTLASHGRSAA
jgi:hypothetical protein